MNQKTGKNFALIGAAGYVAPRHMAAIKETGNNLIAALDKSDSVGVLDAHFYDVAFFTEFERFDRHAEKLRRQGEGKRLHYISICSPNYLHDAHIRFALRIGADAICEKPLVLNPWNLDALEELEKETGKRIYTTLQLRMHPTILAVRDKIHRSCLSRPYAVDLTYITSRGLWYNTSWKGDISKSGGIATNIGIHFFDALVWIFGGVERLEVHVADSRRMAGAMVLERAHVRWFLSVDNHDLPARVPNQGQATFRSITIDGEELEFSGGFADLHTAMYREILAGRGPGVIDARPSIDLAYRLRQAAVTEGDAALMHPLIKNRRFLK